MEEMRLGEQTWRIKVERVILAGPECKQKESKQKTQPSNSIIEMLNFAVFLFPEIKTKSSYKREHQTTD